MTMGVREFIKLSSIRVSATITTMMILIVSKAMTIRHTPMLTMAIRAKAVIVTAKREGM